MCDKSDVRATMKKRLILCAEPSKRTLVSCFTQSSQIYHQFIKLSIQKASLELQIPRSSVNNIIITELNSLPTNCRLFTNLSQIITFSCPLLNTSRFIFTGLWSKFGLFLSCTWFGDLTYRNKKCLDISYSKHAIQHLGRVQESLGNCTGRQRCTHKGGLRFYIAISKIK